MNPKDPQAELNRLRNSIYEIVGNTDDLLAIMTLVHSYYQAHQQEDKHWYMGFDDNGRIAMFPKEVGVSLKQAITTTRDTIKSGAQLELLTELLGELPEKIEGDGGVAVALSSTQDLWKAATTAHNNAIDQVVSVIERKIGELNG